jgi:hypothetical protein
MFICDWLVFSLVAVPERIFNEYKQLENSGTLDTSGTKHYEVGTNVAGWLALPETVPHF